MMLSKNFKCGFQKNFFLASRSLSSMVAPPSTKEWFVFPREHEGNVYRVNWSLNEDGVVPKGDAFQNARIPILTTRLPKKVENGKATLDAPLYQGDYKVVEAGDGITIDGFQEKLESQTSYLSSGIDLFIQDAGLGI